MINPLHGGLGRSGGSGGSEENTEDPECRRQEGGFWLQARAVAARQGFMSVVETAADDPPERFLMLGTMRESLGPSGEQGGSGVLPLFLNVLHDIHLTL